jgi:DNA-binding NtrC family response regulator
MSLILIASKDQQACDAIRACLGSEHEIQVVYDKETCLETFRRKRCEFLFVEVLLLGDSSSKKDLSTTLAPFRQAFPASQIIVMSSPEKIRQAVSAVKAGADDYLTCTDQQIVSPLSV